MSFNPIRILEVIADYQFGLGAGKALFNEEIVKNLEIRYSRRTRRIRYALLNKIPYVSVRTSDGYLTLSISAAKNLLENYKEFTNIVVIYNKFEDIVKKNKNVLVKYVKEVDRDLKAGSEVIVVNEDKKILGIGRINLNGEEILGLKRGIAVKLRKIAKNV